VRLFQVSTCLLSLFVSSIAIADDTKTPSNSSAEKNLAIIKTFIVDHSFEAIINSNLTIELKNVDSVKELIWDKYQLDIRKDPVRKKEIKNKAMTFAGKTMKYDYSTIGKKPKAGYPLYIALHGGGGAPKAVNDSQWNHMKVYYKKCVKNGIYLAPRGVTDTWNLHCTGKSMVLYDRLIENMIAFEDVDPNRVYIMGFSAGGDGTYQVACRMADRFAGANMSAGHHNNVDRRNLYKLPFLMQVGERDTAYRRHTATAQFALSLKELRSGHKGGYIYDIFIHHNKPHNFRDYDHRGTKYDIIADPSKWLHKKDRTTKRQDTNAVKWLSQYKRDAYPNHILWAHRTNAKLRDGQKQKNYWTSQNRLHYFYWIGIGDVEAAKDVELLDVKIDKPRNAVLIKEPVDQLTILLTRDMLDLSKEVTLISGQRRLKVKPVLRLATVARTLRDRGDPCWMFECEITVSRDLTIKEK
jgi:poly(3-hydroxybutyrate) depolymerase